MYKTASPLILLHDRASGTWLKFIDPIEVISANTPAEVLPALERIDAAIGNGCWAAGFCSYEAAPACDDSLTVRSDGSGFPLLWFGLYAGPERVESLPEPSLDTFPALHWVPSVSDHEYAHAISRIKNYIGAGDTYQVNFTYRLRATFEDDPLDTFLLLERNTPHPYAAYIDTGKWAVSSHSPELFFSRTGTMIESRPMKGTAPRGLWYDHDLAIRDELAASPKNRAENVMIVDMVRNDLGRVAGTGSVHVPRLFDVERYPTVWQMTSTVRAETDASIGELFQALFPAASITGAPRGRTMGIIAELESTPRRIYTGTIGYASPDNRAQFNVAIRTLLHDRENGTVEYGTGGGIVWDSDTDSELGESLTKTRVLSPGPQFELLETIRWDPAEGFRFLRRHVRRLARSAEYFGFPYRNGSVHRELLGLARSLPAVPHIVRVLLSASGGLRIEPRPIDPAWHPPTKLAVAQNSVVSSDPFLYHKTTNRAVYDAARDSLPGFDDVILANEHGHITESTVANIALAIDGVRWTPALESGLLPGTCREWLLERGWMRERVLTVADMSRATEVFLFNSVRGMYRIMPGHISIDPMNTGA